MKFQAGDKVRVKCPASSIYEVFRPSCDPRYGWKYSLRDCDEPAGCYVDGDFLEDDLIFAGNGMQMLRKVLKK